MLSLTDAPVPRSGFEDPPDATIEDTRFRRYQVNVIVDNSTQHGAPVIYEDNPTHQTLVGRAEHMARSGVLATDFNLLVPGALHRANGGYLILDASKAAGRELRLALAEARAQCRRDPHRDIGAAPELGDDSLSLYRSRFRWTSRSCCWVRRLSTNMLTDHDEEFADLFKIAADFDDRVERSPETTLLYAG